MPIHLCTRCERSDPPPKRCAACKKAWYCSSQCQRRDWVCHIFDCNPTRAITSADYIALAVEQNEYPEHVEAVADYGFGNSTEQEHSDKLLKVYSDLLHPETGRGIKATTLHRWKTEGTLVENMVRELQDLPRESDNDHLSWFLENPDVVDGMSVREYELQWMLPYEQSMRRTFGFIGLSETLPADDMIQYNNSLPTHKQECLMFYSILLMKALLNPSNLTWVKFGFASCRRSSESVLVEMFTMLIHSCTFDEFCAAYESGSLLLLMIKACGIHIVDPYIATFLTETPEPVRSVWWLHQYIENVVTGGHESNPSFMPMNPIILTDYGFMNCKTPEDHRLLIDLYKSFFADMDSDPLALHDACMEGRLFRYFTDDQKCQLRQKKKYRRLLLNPHPSKEL